MTSATALTRLPVFVSGLDSDLASRTWNAYKPSIPTTPEGLAYGGVGFLFSHMLFGGLLSLLRGGRRRPVRHVDVQNTASS
jgi:hypothetical protein